MSDEVQWSWSEPHREPANAAPPCRPDGDGWRCVNVGLVMMTDPDAPADPTRFRFRLWTAWSRPEPAPLPEAKPSPAKKGPETAGPWMWRERGSALRLWGSGGGGKKIASLWPSGRWSIYGGNGHVIATGTDGTRESVAAEARKHWRET